MSQASSKSLRPRPAVLCILDGWGERQATDANAIALAPTPNWDRMVRQWPKSTLDASAIDVGLPAGQMGNSEVGHLNIGAGRVVLQDLPRIDAAIANGSLEKSAELLGFIEKLKASGGACHLLGLVSPGGVHAHQDHIVRLAEIVAAAGVTVHLHANLDGRDTPPTSAAEYMTEIAGRIDQIDGAQISTICGRYYAMDRDKNWDRVVRAYNLLVAGDGTAHDDPVAAIQASYAADVGDEFVLPVAIGEYAGMADGDGLLMANFRADRAREILTALADPDFDGFERDHPIKFAARLGMVEYSDHLNPLFPAIFPSIDLADTLGQVISDAGLRQLRIAETEKYAHVTFFFNGGREATFDGEERILVPSPKVATYDLQPEMSAPEVTDKLVDAIKSDSFDLIIVNFANGDMVGHTGILNAAMKAAETLDASLGRLEAAVVDAGGVMIVTADHGNCEMMVDPQTGGPHTAHTLNDVPLILVNPPADDLQVRHGRLADLAPTLLQLMGLPQPPVMTGKSLIENGSVGVTA